MASDTWRRLSTTIDALSCAPLKLSSQVGNSFAVNECADVVQGIHDAELLPKGFSGAGGCRVSNASRKPPSRFPTCQHRGGCSFAERPDGSRKRRMQ